MWDYNRRLRRLTQEETDELWGRWFWGARVISYVDVDRDYGLAIFDDKYGDLLAEQVIAAVDIPLAGLFTWQGSVLLSPWSPAIPQHWTYVERVRVRGDCSFRLYDNAGGVTEQPAPAYIARIVNSNPAQRWDGTSVTAATARIVRHPFRNPSP